MRGGEGGVEVAEVRRWDDVSGVREGRDDVLWVREESSRPCGMRWWDSGRSPVRLRAVEELIEGVVKERLRDQQRALEKRAKQEEGQT